MCLPTRNLASPWYAQAMAYSLVFSFDFELHEAGVVEFTITDRLGRTVRSEEETYRTGRNQHELDLSRLPNGVYMIGVSSERDVQRKAILKND